MTSSQDFLTNAVQTMALNSDLYPQTFSQHQHSEKSYCKAETLRSYFPVTDTNSVYDSRTILTVDS